MIRLILFIMSLSIKQTYKLLLSFVLIFTLSFIGICTVSAYEKPERSDFVVTAYYSPLPGQSRYHKSNYREEVMLNGLGKVTASGSSIYKGVVAAPSTLAFGTLIEIDGVGFFRVEDRGSAIQNWDEEIRIDVWKGFGEDAMNQSMHWGIRNRQGWVYPNAVNNITPYLFNSNLGIGSSGRDVENLQYQLKQLGFFNHSVTGYYGDITADSVYEYQLFKNIVPNREFLGAGNLGPGTRRRLNHLNESLKLLKENKREANISAPPSKHYNDIIKDLYSRNLSKGDTDYNVYLLQQKLNKAGLFEWPRYTYQYGDATRNAVLNFQLKHGVVARRDQQGAGVFGPATREKMKQVLG